MKQDWADRFSHDVDNLLNEAGLSDLETPSPDYEEMLEVARLLTKTDFSSQSRLRHSLRRRLLNQIEDSLVMTVELPGLVGSIKNLFKRRSKPGYPLSRTHRLFRKRAAIFLAIVATLVTLAFFAPMSLSGVRQQLLTLLAPLFPAPSLDLIGDPSPGVLAVQWQFSGEDGLSTPPLVTRERLFVGSNNGDVYALNPETGRIIWRLPNAGELETQFTLAAGVLYVGSREGTLYAVDAAAGEEQWQFQVDSPITTSPTIAEGVVYVGTEDGTLYAMDVASQQEKWRFQTSGAILSTPVASAGIVYLGSNDWYVYAVDATTGREKWRFKAADWLTASPVIDEAAGMVYIGSHDQYLYALDVVSGREKWRFNAGDNIVAGAALAGDQLYFGSYDGYLYALDAAGGQERWRFWTGKAIQATPLVAGDLVYIGSGEGILYAVEATTGQARQEFDAGSQLYTPPGVASGTLYLTTGKGQLLALQNEPDSSLPLLATTTAQTYTVELARFQFTPAAWFSGAAEVDGLTRFRGRLVDGAGQPVDGFSVEADNGQRRLLSKPTGPDGAWEIVVSDAPEASHWWWLTVGRDECDQAGVCRFSRLSESVKVGVTPPDEATINADWVCRRDCQSFEVKVK